MTIYLQQLALGPMDNFVYLVGDPETKQAAVVDPAWDAAAILKRAATDGYQITHIFLTHGHYDHINATEELVQSTGAIVCAEKTELENFITEGEGGLVIPRSQLKKTDVSDTIYVGKLMVRMIHVPGHTPGSRCISVKGKTTKEYSLFTGDMLFVGTIGRSDFPYSSPRDLFESFKKIKALPDETTFYPGHDYGMTPTNTLGREKKSNPFLIADTLEDFLKLVRR